MFDGIGGVDDHFSLYTAALMQAKSFFVRGFFTRPAANFSNIGESEAIRCAIESSDLFFTPVVRAENYVCPLSDKNEERNFSVSAESMLKQAASNFELEISSTLVVTLDQPLIRQNWSNQYAYHCQLLLARGSSFCQ